MVTGLTVVEDVACGVVIEVKCPCGAMVCIPCGVWTIVCIPAPRTPGIDTAICIINNIYKENYFENSYYFFFKQNKKNNSPRRYVELQFCIQVVKRY